MRGIGVETRVLGKEVKRTPLRNSRELRPRGGSLLGIRAARWVEGHVEYQCHLLLCMRGYTEGLLVVGGVRLRDLRAVRVAWVLGMFLSCHENSSISTCIDTSIENTSFKGGGQRRGK
jgi:hypothetical protein